MASSRQHCACHQGALSLNDERVAQSAGAGQASRDGVRPARTISCRLARQAIHATLCTPGRSALFAQPCSPVMTGAANVFALCLAGRSRSALPTTVQGAAAVGSMRHCVAFIMLALCRHSPFPQLTWGTAAASGSQIIKQQYLMRASAVC